MSEEITQKCKDLVINSLFPNDLKSVQKSDTLAQELKAYFDDGGMCPEGEDKAIIERIIRSVLHRRGKGPRWNRW